MFRYVKLAARPQQLFRFTGLTVEQFTTLASRLAPLWEAAEQRRLARPNRQRAIGAGRTYTLARLEDKRLLALVFYRLYLTEDLLSWLFGFHRSNVNRLLHRLEPLVATAADPALRHGLREATRQRRRIGRWEDCLQAYPDLAEVVIDATEQPRRRPPRRSQRRWYSGKRKRHTVKTQLTVSRRGRILHVRDPVPGRVHDYALFKRLRMTARRPAETRRYLDRGYDGAATDSPTPILVLPVKRRRNHRVLLPWEWLHNVWQAGKRVIIEHLMARMKKYQLLAQGYRHRVGQYGQRVRNIAALVNFRTQPAAC
jgi:hypothetical protein